MKKSTILLGFATRIAKVVFGKDIFRCGKGIDQFGFAGIVDAAEQDVAVCFECHNSSAGIRFAHGKVDGLTQVLLDDVGGISFCAEERDVGWADILCFFLECEYVTHSSLDRVD